MFVLPLIILIAFEFGGNSDNGGGDRGQFAALADIATSGGLNFALFTLLVSASFLLVVVVALFHGDTIASEASWGSLRYLLAIPVPRARLLGSKLLVALTYSGISLILLTATALAAGTARYGWHPLRSNVADDIARRTGAVAAARHRRVPRDHPAHRRGPRVPAVGVDRRAARRGRWRGPAADPVEHPGPDHRARLDPQLPADALLGRVARVAVDAGAVQRDDQGRDRGRWSMRRSSSASPGGASCARTW